MPRQRLRLPGCRTALLAGAALAAFWLASPLASPPAWAHRPVLVGPRVKSIDAGVKWGVDHRDRFPVFNRLPLVAAASDTTDIKPPTKTDEHVLLERWLELHEAVRGWSVSAEPFEDRTLAQLFPNTHVYRLIARSSGLRASRYGCVSLGVPLVLPEDINLLLVLENRRLNRYNARSLAEVLVRMVDPEGPTTMRIISRKVHRDRQTNEMSEVELESWSYNQGLRKRWTFIVSVPYFHSLAEKVLSVRPRIFDEVRPESGTFLNDDEYRTSDRGGEIYIAFWRSPERRNEMRAIRETWLARRHGTGVEPGEPD